MKNAKKNLTLLAVLLLSGASSLMAQPAPPVDPTPLPGIALLMAAGAALGGKKLYDSKKAQDNKQD